MLYTQVSAPSPIFQCSHSSTSTLTPIRSATSTHCQLRSSHSSILMPMLGTSWQRMQQSHSCTVQAPLLTLGQACGVQLRSRWIWRALLQHAFEPSSSPVCSS